MLLPLRVLSCQHIVAEGHRRSYEISIQMLLLVLREFWQITVALLSVTSSASALAVHQRHDQITRAPSSHTTTTHTCCRCRFAVSDCYRSHQWSRHWIRPTHRHLRLSSTVNPCFVLFCYYIDADDGHNNDTNTADKNHEPSLLPILYKLKQFCWNHRKQCVACFVQLLSADSDF